MADIDKVEFNANPEWERCADEELAQYTTAREYYYNEKWEEPMDDFAPDELSRPDIDAVYLLKGGHPRFNELLEKMSELHADKDHDYSKDGHLANFYVSEDFGIPAWKGCLIRLSDKFSRIKSLVKKGNNQVKDESLIDSLQDLAVYSLLTIILLEETENAPQAKEKAC